ncbi:lipoate--protein ligase family protein [Spirillospora sp. CA-294931]|uniref:lipoate--protein ligase family protein n=1 Tax=Spirillospora sp. CA-294931 TaxID=3240042 RepID=UPI003D90D5EC
MLCVIVDGTRDPAWNLALDEALARSGEARSTTRPGPVRPPSTRPPGPRSAPRDRASGGFPLLRVWQNDPCVVVGRFQSVGDAVDLAACASDGVRVVRRFTGGGAVYTDPGTLNFTLVRPGKAWSGRPDLDALVASALEGLGLPTGAPGGGVTRVARLRTRRATLTHVAVHVAPLRPGGDRYVVPHPLFGSERTTLADLGLAVTLDAVRAAILCALVDAYGIACTRPLNQSERAWRAHLHTLRYGDVTWHLTGAPGPLPAVREFTGG